MSSSVTLQFRSASLLWAFKQEINATDVAIDLKHCTLTCTCSDREIQIAVEKFGATVVPAEAT